MQRAFTRTIYLCKYEILSVLIIELFIEMRNLICDGSDNKTFDLAEFANITALSYECS
jgi:hypothetical protein